jgi:ATP-dependent protease ClpP protease subunit
MNYTKESDWDLRKKAWHRRYRWATVPSDIWCSLDGDLDCRAVDRIIAAIEQAPDAPVFLQVHSHGDSVGAAWECYERLRQHPGPVTTVAGSRCHSAAMILYLGGDTRLASRSSRFLIHGSAGELIGRASAVTLRSALRDTEEVDQDMLDLICLRANNRYPLWQARNEMYDEITLTGAGAHSRGLVTQLID